MVLTIGVSPGGILIVICLDSWIILSFPLVVVISCLPCFMIIFAFGNSYIRDDVAVTVNSLWCKS